METKFLPYGAPNHPSVKPVDLKNLKPYGDAMNDGRTQVSFTLPINPSPEAEETARELMRKMGFEDVKIVAMEKPSEGFSFLLAMASPLFPLILQRSKSLKWKLSLKVIMR